MSNGKFDMKTVLNIAAGKILPNSDLNIDYKHAFLVNLDPMYFGFQEPSEIENHYKLWMEMNDSFPNQNDYTNLSANEFMERSKIIFDVVTCYRYLEHVSMDQVLYFLYLISTSLKIGGIADIIVPNYEVLAEMLINEDVKSSNFEAHNILLTTELLNVPSCPHASIWTKERLHHFLELEGRFKIEKYHDRYEFDGRDIYCRVIATRIK